MSQYLILAENITFKNGKLSCINIYDKLTTLAMPAEFTFDLAVICGPNWKAGEHNLTIKVRGNNGKESVIGELKVDIPNHDFVYNAYANDVKIVMDYSVKNLTIVIYDDNTPIIVRKYPVISMLVPKENNIEKTETQKRGRKRKAD